MSTLKNKNYLIQSNYFTQSVLKDVTETQKDIIYYLQTLIDFRDKNPSELIYFNYNDFLKFKKVKKNDYYSIQELLNICTGLRSINGVFYNKSSKSTVFFNIIDNVEVNDDDQNEFKITLAKWGKIFFFEKDALEYSKRSNIEYTHIESSIVDLSGSKRKKFFEILSQYKSTGVLKISVENLKIKLGFIEYEAKEVNKENKEMQLRILFDSTIEEEKFNKIEYLKTWDSFKRSFLDPAIENFNNNGNLDISHISYTTLKIGRKITGLHFTFQKKLEIDNLSDLHRTALKEFLLFGLTEGQIIFLLQRIGHENMYNAFNNAVCFNKEYENKDSIYYRRKIWFEKKSGNPINNLGGFLYENVFFEYLKK